MKSSKLTLEFRGTEAKILEDLVEEGIFSTKSEAVRSALIKMAIDLGYFSREEIWKDIKKHKRRKVSAKKLMKDIERIKNEI